MKKVEKYKLTTWLGTMISMMVFNVSLYAGDSTCPTPRDPSDVVKIDVMTESASKAKEAFENAGTTTKLQYLNNIRELVILSSTKKEAIKKEKDQLNLEEISLQTLDQQVEAQLVAVVGQEKATQLISDWNKNATDAERAKLIAEFSKSKGSYAGLMASFASQRGVSMDALQKAKDVSLDFVSVAPGEFTMGSPSNEEGRYSDEAQHQVKITKPFEFGKTDVTQLEYYLVTGSNPSRFIDASASDYIEVNGAKMNANQPVEQVSWNDAQEFIRKLNEQDSKYIYSLPTEAQFEYAARGGTTTAYPFGNRKAELSEYAVYADSSGSQTAQVASKKPNPLGAYDVQGNVWKWCNDWYCESPKGGEDPTGPDSGSVRVLRGGSWYVSARGLRAAYRNSGWPAHRGDSVGFRLVRTAK